VGHRSSVLWVTWVVGGHSVFLWLTELKIHVSEDTKAILDTFNTFQLELRGPVEMKVV